MTPAPVPATPIEIRFNRGFAIAFIVVGSVVVEAGGKPVRNPREFAQVVRAAFVDKVNMVSAAAHHLAGHIVGDDPVGACRRDRLAAGDRLGLCRVDGANERAGLCGRCRGQSRPE